MDHLFEVLKIIDGALRHDPKKVATYAQQLATKLEAGGDPHSAKSVRRALSSVEGTTLQPAKFAPARVPVDSESRLQLADEEIITLEDVHMVLSSEVRQRVEEFVRYARNVDKLIASGVGISPSLLLYGAPGNGKTALARLIAAELGLPLVTGRADALISSFLGSTAKNIRALCEYAQSHPCVLFFDEIDAVAKLRDDQHELGELKRVVVSLLQNLDALGSKTVLLAATNHEHLLDPALWRRFAYKLHVGAPAGAARAGLFTEFLGSFINPAEATPFASVSEGMSGADIKQICDDAKRDAVIAGLARVDEASVLRRIVFTISPDARKASTALDARVRAAKALNPKVFTVRRLASVFGISVGKVHAILQKE
jgi:SpoVK/Ycf46/Vps4 family AAA+-type ATPase